MSISTIVSIATLFLIAVISFLVFGEDRKNKVNVSFGLMGAAIALWILSNILANISTTIFSASLWSKMAIVGPAIIPNLFLYLIIRLYYPENTSKYRPISIFLFLISALIIILSPTYLNVKDVAIESWGVNYYPGILYYILFFQLVVGFGAAFYLLAEVFIYSQDHEKHSQSKFILLGTISSVILATLTNIVLPFFGYGFASIFGPPSVLLFIGFMGYAVTRHHLFNVKVIATELLTFAIWTFLLIQALVAGSLSAIIANSILLILVIFFGIFLIRSVIKEVEQREKLEKLTQELEAANVQLVKLDKLKSEFLSFASHQVKSPMAVVKGYASLIADGTYGQASDQVKETAKKIMSAADRMVALVNNILDLRKIEEGKMEYAFADVDVADLTRGIVNELKTIADERKLELKSNIPETPLIVKADKEKLRQVIQNLIDNALKYTETGWVSAEVKEEPGPEPKVLISVSDSGRGMSKELLPKLFEQWSRDSKAAKEIQGTGLGLYIAKEIVTTHGGEIWAESDGEGKGSKFSVRLKLSTSANKPNA